jgi:hypothetical protein
MDKPPRISEKLQELGALIRHLTGYIKLKAGDTPDPVRDDLLLQARQLLGLIEIYINDAALPMTPIKILVADVPEILAEVDKQLGKAFSLVLISKFEEARDVIDEGCDVIVCGVHFADGSMFDLLRYAKSRAGSKNIPFVCVKFVADAMSDAIFRSIHSAATILGADDFVDLGHTTRTGQDAFARLGLRLMALQRTIREAS